jgi:hypothetical protein
MVVTGRGRIVVVDGEAGAVAADEEVGTSVVEVARLPSRSAVATSTGRSGEQAVKASTAQTPLTQLLCIERG